MAVPSSRELSKNRKGSKYKQTPNNYSEKSKYLSYKLDFERGLLAGYKLKEFERLKRMFEK